MSKTKKAGHTPGPWTQDTSHSDDREGVSIWAKDVIVADAVDDQHGNAKANAALIAASPEMIRALVSIMFAAEHGEITRETLTAIKTMARNAIRKAQG